MKAMDESIAGQRVTFLKTLQVASSQKIESEGSPQSVRTESAKGDDVNVGSMPSGILKDPHPPGKDTAELDRLTQTLMDPRAVLTTVAAELSDLLSIARATGIRTSASDQGQVPGSTDVQFPTDIGLSGVTDSAALKELIGQLEENGQMPSQRVAAWLNRVTPLIAMTTPLDGTQPNGDLSADGILPNPAAEPAAAAPLQMGISPGAADPKADIFWRMGDASNGRQTSSATCRPPAIADFLTSNGAKTESMQPDRNMTQALSSENWGKFSYEKSAAEIQAVKGAIPVAQVASAAKESSDCPGKANFSGLPDNLSRIGLSVETVSRNGGSELQDYPPKKDSLHQSVATDSSATNKNTIQPSSGEESISKIINNTQVIRDMGTKLGPVPGEEVTGKVLKVDGGQPDGGLQGSQSQTADRAFETASSLREVESSHGSLREQTLDQIVKKAVIHLRNGQNEAKIHLKPEFLGNIRMQVFTENHQVSIKILAEHAFVKEMLENHIQQLKSELQQQGLAVERVEVSVSRDSAGFDHARENTQRLKAKHRRGENGRAVNPTDEIPVASQLTALTPEGMPNVDYFA
jgi:flagellar hook-length control protein FliK